MPHAAEDTVGGMLRDVRDADVSIFFEHQPDEDARHIVAFTSKDANDRDAFDAHWARIRQSDTVMIRTVEIDAAVTGHVASFEMEEVEEWILWNNG